MPLHMRASRPDPATLVLSREEDLPAAVLQRGAIQRGSVITFVRGPDGRVTASAGGVELASVRSPHLAAALFDLYIGDQVRVVQGIVRSSCHNRSHAHAEQGCG